LSAIAEFVVNAAVQGSVDDGIPRYGVSGRKPGVVDLGGGGRFLQSPDGTETGDEGVRQDAASADRRPRRAGACSITIIVVVVVVVFVVVVIILIIIVILHHYCHCHHHRVGK